MKMKKPTEKTMLTAAIQPLISSFLVVFWLLDSRWQSRPAPRWRKTSAPGSPASWRDRASSRREPPASPSIYAFRKASPAARYAPTISPDGLRQAMRPGMRRAHHDALEHGLPAHQGLLAALERGQQLHRHKKTPPLSQETACFWMPLLGSKAQSTRIPQRNSFRMAQETPLSDERD